MIDNKKLLKEIQDLVTKRNDWKKDAKNFNRGYAREKLRDSNNPLMEMIIAIDYIEIYGNGYNTFKCYFNNYNELVCLPVAKEKKACGTSRSVVGLKLNQLLAMYRDYLKSKGELLIMECKRKKWR